MFSVFIYTHTQVARSSHALEIDLAPGTYSDLLLFTPPSGGDLHYQT